MLIKHCLVDLVLKNVGMVCLNMYMEVFVVGYLVFVIYGVAILKGVGSSTFT